MYDVFIMAVIMSVPVAGILSATRIKLRKMELERLKSGVSDEHLDVIVQNMQKLSQENAQLKNRIENLETIVALGEHGLISETERQYNQLPPRTMSSLSDADKLSGEIAEIVANRRKDGGV